MEATAIKTDLRLAREDVCRLQQDLEDAEEKLKDGEGRGSTCVIKILLDLVRSCGNIMRHRDMLLRLCLDSCVAGFVDT